MNKKRIDEFFKIRNKKTDNERIQFYRNLSIKNKKYWVSKIRAEKKEEEEEYLKCLVSDAEPEQYSLLKILHRLTLAVENLEEN